MTLNVYKRKANMSKACLPLTVFALIGFISTTVYFSLGDPALALIDKNQLKTNSTVNSEPELQRLQTALRDDKQNGQLWFQLGNEYMAQGEFDNATLVYQYAERLSDSPNADIYAALASARYYNMNQKLDKTASAWINKALAIDSNHVPALTVIASDHYLSARYQDAIDAWVRILDTNNPTANRVNIIRSINQAKSML
ncbi:hypothetical protein [Enterovibrio nigricans]|uniref:Formate-dependent nitrite reductase complex subunit NrfG n=1 Tax=Enterovibrio nigricans DSM 22720 TaxID=1121868 RepID=A0A1T4V6F3_9GAMM|nr:hypothetical protein [Enterovibrio nigricans]PKF50098.1 nitrite reductase [Enterovibrio nigricans]SKA60484.1 formate-dependent nitrite reductase complex subunit NrfG [Enterovibrio nigricans DSM 22720]